MDHSIKYFYLIIIFIVGSIDVYGNVILSKAVECECFNSTHTSSQDDCKDNVVRCINNESDRPGACFVLWVTDSETGKKKTNKTHFDS